MYYFKIRRKSDGMFSTGGLLLRFSKKGKTWNRPDDVARHVTMLDEYGNHCRQQLYVQGYRGDQLDNHFLRSLKGYKEGCEIVVYKAKEVKAYELTSSNAGYLGDLISLMEHDNERCSGSKSSRKRQGAGGAGNK